MNVRFAEPRRDFLLHFKGKEPEVAEAAFDKPLAHLCLQDIFLGIFFDGTNNHTFRDTSNDSPSNVARLHESFI